MYKIWNRNTKKYLHRGTTVGNKEHYYFWRPEDLGCFTVATREEGKTLARNLLRLDSKSISFVRV